MAAVPPLRPLIRRRHATWLRQLAFVLAMLSQAVGALTTVYEGRGGLGKGTHIEGVGSKSHYVHDESTCIACHVRSVHGRTTMAPRFERLQPLETAAIAPLRTRAVHGERVLLNHSRAPPEEI